MAERSKRRRRKEHQPGWKGFRADLRTSLSRLFARSSTNHKRFVLFVLLVGVVLRILRMNEPVTYDEALTYVHYAGRSFSFLFSDYLFTSNQILFSAFARASTLVFGVQPWSLRLPALLAGILVMPLCYAFARVVFNRHIAVITLCLVAVNGPLVEYSAIARGYSFIWLFTISSLLAARHFVKSDNLVSAAFLALFCALGMWVSPAMIYPAVMVFSWAFFMLVSNYQSSLRRRVMKLTGALLLSCTLVLLFYTPVVVVHSLDQLLHHPSVVENTWTSFVNSQQDRAFDLWAYFTGTSSSFLAFAGAVGMTYAAYISVKYRLLLFALVVGTVPLVLLQLVVAPPAVWTFSLPVFHLGSAIGLFYLLKVVRDKMVPNFTKSQRTLVAGAAMLLIFGWLGVRGEGDTVERYPEAQMAAAWIKTNTNSDDRVCVQLPWNAPVGFYLAREHGDPQVLRRGRAAGRTYVLVSPGHGQTVEGVLLDAELSRASLRDLQLLQGWGRLELFGTR
ncbi:MAG: glycosyltransferase family 39 protein [Flavobacteriales bacterium]|jgi:hypothetical protein|nr:glycosyltransferase family 39 protein [Flavobacteriales bacterium]